MIGLDDMRLKFDGFELDLEGCVLKRAGAPVPLEPRTMDLLCYLAARPERLIRKHELLSEVWKAQSLSEGVLSNTIGKLRAALGQNARANSPIETVRGRGYRWRALADLRPTASVASVAAEPAAMGAPAVEPYVGRSSTLQVLSDAIERTVTQRTGQLILFVGEAGIGKTRTLEELARRATARGFVVWSGSAYDGAGAPAYWPWVEVLRAAYVALGPATFRDHVPAGAQSLPQLVPELLPPPAAASGDTGALRFQLFDELTRFLRSASDAAPCLIWLDDLHWADPATLELLAYAARALAKRPVLFAAGLRDRELQSSETQGPALRRLERIAVHLSLNGLAEDEISELLMTLPGAPLMAAPARAALYRRTQGNPFFIAQIVAWMAQRAVAPDVQNVESIELPAAVRGVIQQRIAGLNPRAQHVLAAASVIGADFDACTLASLLDLGLDATLSALEPACLAGVIERRKGPEHHFEFNHALVREVSYQGLSMIQAGALHAKLAHALSARPLLRDRRGLGDVARHYLLAVPSELELCVRYCRLAAEAARQSSGFEVAADVLSRALAKLAGESGDGTICSDLLLELGFDQLCCDDADAAWQTLERGAKLAQELGRADLLAAFACRMADWLPIGGGEAQTRMFLARALESLSEDDIEPRSSVMARVALIAPELTRTERETLFDRAQSLAAQRADPALWLDVAFCRASVRDPRDARASRAARDRYRELYQSQPAAHAGIRDELRFVGVEVTEYFAAFTLGEFAESEAAFARVIAAERRCQVRAVERRLELLAAGRLHAAGKLDELEATVRSQLEAAQSSGSRNQQGAWLLYALQLADARGDLAAFATLELPMPGAPEAKFGAQLTLGLAVWRAWLFAVTDRLAQAVPAVRAISAQQIEALPLSYGDVGLLSQLADIAYAVRDTQLARVVRERLAPHAAYNAVGMLGEGRGCVAHQLGKLAALESDVPGACALFAQAADAHERWRMPLALQRTRALLAHWSAQR